MSDKVISSTTQEFLDVYDIVNDMVLLKDGTAAIILQIGTMNFSLLAEQEQDAVIFTYGSLLNSLNYPIQINIQSQTKDATKYLRLLDEQIAKASSDRKANLIKKYRDFVAALIKERNVLQKRFYIVVPATPGEMGLITPSSVLPGKTSFDISMVEKSILLEKATNLLEPRKDHLTSQFNRLGLYARQLATQEIIQNFYINYNPEAAEGQEISSSENYTTPLVRASFGGKLMQPTTNNPTAEEIISGNPAPTAAQANQSVPAAAQTNPVIQAEPVVQPEAQPQSQIPVTATTPSMTPETQITPPTPASEPVLVEQQTQVLQSVEPAQQNLTNASELPSNPVSSSTISPDLNTAINSMPDLSANTTAEIPAPNNVFPEEQKVEEKQDQPAELDLNLNADLIASNKPQSDSNSDFTQNFVEESVSYDAAEQNNSQADSQPNISAGQNEPVSDFAEEITPLQNKFNSQNAR